MLAILLTWLIAGYISCSLGRGTFALFSGSTSRENLPFIFHLLLGFATVIFLAHIWSFFFKVDWVLLSLLGFLSLIVNLKLKDIILKPSRTDLYLYLPLIVLSLLLSIGTPNNVDEAGYYLPTVRWMEDYPVTKGISLLIARLGFNSGFHMISATFSLKNLFPGGVYELNGLLFYSINVYLWKQAISTLNANRTNWVQLIFLLALVFPFSFLVPSMDTDYLSIFGLVLIIGWCLKSLFHGAKIRKSKFLSFAWIIGMLCTVKFITILVLIPFVIALIYNRNKQLIIKSCLLIAVALTPWILRNIFISGYAIFPIYHIDLCDANWKMPYEMIKASHAIVGEFAKVEIIRGDYILSGIKEWPLSTWIPIWIDNQKIFIIGILIMVALPLSFFIGLIPIAFSKGKDKILQKQFRILWFSTTIILTIWFLNFPAIRFGWPWILSYCSITFFYIINNYLPQWQTSIYKLLFLLVLISWMRLFYNNISQTIHNLPAKLLMHESHLPTSDYTTKTIGNVEFKIVQDNYCKGNDLPCIPANNPYKVIPVSNSILDGFVIDITN